MHNFLRKFNLIRGPQSGLVSSCNISLGGPGGSDAMVFSGVDCQESRKKCSSC
jgi:hypothetical protein